MANKLIHIILFSIISIHVNASFNVSNDTCDDYNNYKSYRILKIHRIKKNIFAIDVSYYCDGTTTEKTIISVKDKNEKYIKIKKGEKYNMRLISYFGQGYSYPFHDDFTLQHPQNIPNYYLIQGKKIKITSYSPALITPNLKGLYYINPEQEDSLESIQKEYIENSKKFMLKFLESIHTEDDTLFLSMLGINRLMNSIQSNLKLNRKDKFNLKSNHFKLADLFFNMWTPEQKKLLTPDNLSITLLNCSNNIFTFRINWTTIYLNNRPTKLNYRTDILLKLVPASFVIAIENKNSNIKVVGFDLFPSHDRYEWWIDR